MRGGLPTFLTLLLTQASIPGPAQQPGEKPPVFPAGVDLVALDVGVFDDAGRPVPDLRAEDFEVRLSGKARRLLGAEFISRTGEAREPPERTTTPFFSSNEALVQGRLILLAVDDGNIPAGRGRAAIRTAERLLDLVGPADRVGLVTVPGPKPIEDFTTDRTRIRAALRKIVGQARLLGRRVSLSESWILMNHEEQRWQEVVDRLCRASDTRCPSDLRSDAREVWTEAEATAYRCLEVLHSSLAALQAIEGRKVMVLVTQGLGLPGAGARGSATSNLAELAAAARAARASFYVVLLEPEVMADMESRVTERQLAEDRELHMRALDYLADQAGGTILRGAPETSFERIALEMTGHYQLGFEPEDKDRDDKEHEVTVKVRRPGLTIRVGRSVIVPKAGTKRAESALLAALLRSPVAATALPLRTATWALKDVATGKVRLLVETEAGGERLPGGASLAYVLVDEKGKTAAKGLQTMTEPGEPAETAGIVLDVDPGRFRLRIAARDRKGRVGSLEHAVTALLQATEDIELSDLLLGPEPESGVAFRPSLDPWIASPNGGLVSHLELYAKQADVLEPLRVWVEVARPHEATPIRTLPARMLKSAQDERRVAQAVIKAADLEPGEYVARADVFQGDRMLASVERPFRVVAP